MPHRPCVPPSYIVYTHTKNGPSTHTYRQTHKDTNTARGKWLKHTNSLTLSSCKHWLNKASLFSVSVRPPQTMNFIHSNKTHSHTNSSRHCFLCKYIPFLAHAGYGKMFCRIFNTHFKHTFIWSLTWTICLFVGWKDGGVVGICIVLFVVLANFRCCGFMLVVLCDVKVCRRRRR